MKRLIKYVMEVYGPNSCYLEEQKRDPSVITKLIKSSERFNKDLDSFKAVPCTDEAIKSAKAAVKKEFNSQYYLSSLDIETFSIKLERNTSEHVENLLKLLDEYGIDPNTQGNQIPWQVSLVGDFWSEYTNKVHHVEKVFHSSPDMMDSCIDQLITYMIRQGFLKIDSNPTSK